MKLASKFRAFAARCKQELVIQIITDVHSGAKGCHDQIPIPNALPVRVATALSLSPRLLRSGALLIFTRKYCPWPPSFATRRLNQRKHPLQNRAKANEYNEQL